MSNGKIVTSIIGPVLAKTRFKSFVQSNDKTLNNFIYVVDNYPIYEPYRDQLTIVDVEKVRETHEWSKNHEWLSMETDPKNYIKNWKDIHNYKEGRAMTGCFVRFGLLEALNQGHKNILLAGSNLIVSNNQEKIDNFFNNIEEGTLNAPYYFFDYSDDCMAAINLVIDDLRLEFPYIDFPKDRFYMDGQLSFCSFRTIEDGMLFYKIWDSILRHLYEKKYTHSIYTVAGYTQHEKVLGYVFKIFHTNFGYKIGNQFTDTFRFSRHVVLIYDNYYCHFHGLIRYMEQYGFHQTEDMDSVSDFIKSNKENLEKYFLEVYSSTIDYEIKDDYVLTKLKE